MYGALAVPIPERERRRLVRLVLCAFWLLIFEGSIRKWVAPRYSAYLYFLRDPLTLYIYYVAARAGIFRDWPALLRAGMGVALVAGLFAVVHVVAGGNQYTPVLAAYGMRNYFLYIPLAFVIGRCFEFDDIRALAHHCLLAMLIAAPIAVLQFNAPANHPLNVGIASDIDLQFENLASGGGRVRPAGTFTSAVGMSQLIPLCAVFLMWAWTSSRRPRPVQVWLAGVATLATAAALAVSGSRTSFIYSCLVIATGVFVAPLLRGAASKLRSIAIPVGVAAAFALLFPVVFPEAFASFTSRWTDAAANESGHFQLGVTGRALHGFYDFFRLMGEMPLSGEGVGMAGNGASMSGVTYNGMSILRVAEEDWSRHVVELGPVLALVFIGWRIGFGIWLGRNAWRATRSSGDSLPLMLFVYAAVPLVQGQITGHGLVNGFGWLFVGTCMAAARSAVQQGAAAALPGSDLPTLVPVSPLFPNLMR